jgi:hypothetical protein
MNDTTTKKKEECEHKNCWPDFESWELKCSDCGKRRDMEEEEGNQIFNRMFGFSGKEWH